MRRLAVLLLALAMPLSAQATHPDFSGTWTLNAAQSGEGMAGASATVTIAQNEKSVKIDQTLTTPMGSQASSASYSFDGTSKNTLNAQGMSVDLTSTTAWEGATLVVTTMADVQGNPVKTVDHWVMDSTGKVLTLSTDISFGPQSMTRKRVFRKA